LKLGLPSVSNYVKRLEREGLIMRERRGVYMSYVAAKNELFKVYKRNDVLLRLYESGLLNFLMDRFTPDAIVLFGSASRGEDVEESDIDLLVIAKEQSVDLRKFENILKRKISLEFEPNVSDIPRDLMNNVVNGIVVHGYLKVF
jgi:predicted nucleotidyltransferase